jgi:hypothetical protein
MPIDFASLRMSRVTEGGVRKERAVSVGVRGEGDCGACWVDRSHGERVAMVPKEGQLTLGVGMCIWPGDMLTMVVLGGGFAL